MAQKYRRCTQWTSWRFEFRHRNALTTARGCKWLVLLAARGTSLHVITELSIAYEDERLPTVLPVTKCVSELVGPIFDEKEVVTNQYHISGGISFLVLVVRQANSTTLPFCVKSQAWYYMMYESRTRSRNAGSGSSLVVGHQVQNLETLFPWLSFEECLNKGTILQYVAVLLRYTKFKLFRYFMRSLLIVLYSS